MYGYMILGGVTVLFVEMILFQFAINKVPVGSSRIFEMRGIWKKSRLLSSNDLLSPTRSSVDFSVVGILTSAGVNVSEEIPSLAELPSESEIIRMYGSKPVLAGLDTCEAFREAVPAISRMIAPAGMFNTGTNLMTTLLRNNCYIKERVDKLGKGSPGMRRQVPWGKHSPASWRLKHQAQEAGDLKHQEYVLPAVVIKDPYTWMTSMCRHTYHANWLHTKLHCPNLIADKDDALKFKKLAYGKKVPVNVHYSDENITHHESLVDLWNDYYREWYQEVSYPRVIVRFEDLLFRPQQIVREVCQCAGGVMRDTFLMTAESAKTGVGHIGSAGLIESVKRYGNSTKRFEPYQSEDLAYAKNTVDTNLSRKFHY